jgi:hypothetical protein
MRNVLLGMVMMVAFGGIACADSIDLTVVPSALKVNEQAVFTSNASISSSPPAGASWVWALLIDTRLRVDGVNLKDKSINNQATLSYQTAEGINTVIQSSIVTIGIQGGSRVWTMVDNKLVVPIADLQGAGDFTLLVDVTRIK